MVEVYPYLGVEIDEDFSFAEQLTGKCKKVDKKIGAIRKWACKEAKLNPWLQLKKIYLTLARPAVEYAAQVFSLEPEDLEILEEWQTKHLRKCLRPITENAAGADHGIT